MAPDRSWSGLKKANGPRLRYERYGGRRQRNKRFYRSYKNVHTNLFGTEGAAKGSKQRRNHTSGSEKPQDTKRRRGTPTDKKRVP